MAGKRELNLGAKPATAHTVLSRALFDEHAQRLRNVPRAVQHAILARALAERLKFDDLHENVIARGIHVQRSDLERSEPRLGAVKERAMGTFARKVSTAQKAMIARSAELFWREPDIGVLGCLG